MLRTSLLFAVAIALAPASALAASDTKDATGAAAGQTSGTTATKNISDGAAKGQANEQTVTPPGKGCAASPAKDNGQLSTYRTTDSASPSVACRKKLPGKMKSGTL